MQHVRLYTRTELASPKMYGTCCVLQDACEREDTDDAADGPSLQVAPRTSSAPALQCHPPATGGKGRTCFHSAWQQCRSKKAFARSLAARVKAAGIAVQAQPAQR
eukprot:scaffold115081_cov20-Tisochrysis_lutea.AAC.1